MQSGDEEITVKMGDEALAKLLGMEEKALLALDEDALAENLLFRDNMKLVVNKDTLVAL